MGRTVNLVLSNGRVVSVDEDVAKEASKTGTTHIESDAEGGDRLATAANKEELSGIGHAAEAGLYGALDTVTFGGFGKLATSGDGADAQYYRALADEQSTARGVGTAAALLFPTGWAGAGAKTAAEATPLFRLTNATSKALGPGSTKALLAEGALFGVGSHIAESNLSGDPLTIEGTLQSAGVGAVLNFGIGKITQTLFGKTAEAIESEAKNKALADARDAYAAAKDATKAAQKTAQAEIGGIKAANTAAVERAGAEVTQLSREAKEQSQQFNEVLDSNPTSYQDFVQTQKDLKLAAQKADKDAIKQFDDLVKLRTKEASKFDLAKQAHGEKVDSIVAAHKAYSKAANGLGSDHELIEKFLNNVDSLSAATKDIRKTLTAAGRADSTIEIEQNAIRGFIKRARLALDSGDTAKAMDELNSGIKAVRRTNPKYNPPSPEFEAPSTDWPGKFPGERPIIPDAAMRPVPTVDATPTLPKNLSGLADMDAQAISRVANSIEDGGPLHEALNKFATDVGLAPSKTAAETLAGIHETLQDVKLLAKGENQSLLDAIKKLDDAHAKSAADELAAAERMQELNSAVLPPKPAKISTKDINGGGLTGKLAWIFSKMAPPGLAQGAVAGTMLTARAMLAKSANSFFLNFGKTAATISKGLQPLTAHLGTSILTGEKEKATDARDLALSRIHELQNLQTMSRDASFSAFQSLSSMPNDISFKLHTAVTNVVDYLNMVAPKDPGLAINVTKSTWKPSYAEALKFSSVIEAATSPMNAIKRLIAGKGTTEASNALWALYPATMQEMSNSLVEGASKGLSNLTREQSTALSRLFRVPLTGFQMPEVMAKLQASFLPVPPEEPSTPPSKRPTGGAPGRPSAINTNRNPFQSRVSQLQI